MFQYHGLGILVLTKSKRKCDMWLIIKVTIHNAEGNMH